MRIPDSSDGLDPLPTEQHPFPTESLREMPRCKSCGILQSTVLVRPCSPEIGVMESNFGKSWCPRSDSLLVPN